MEKQPYKAPTLKVVSFRNEAGFAASQVPTQAGQFLFHEEDYSFINTKDNNTADQNERYIDGGTWEW